MPIEPGHTLGFLGGGQLARMTALAARNLGYNIAVLDPNPLCPAKPFSDPYIAGTLADPQAAKILAQHAHVVTLDIEHVGPLATQAIEALVPLRPGSHVVHMIQNRATQKQWLEKHGYPVGPFAVIDSVPTLAAVLQTWHNDKHKEHPPTRLKTQCGGYDGHGQVCLEPGNTSLTALQAAWDQILGASVTGGCVLEEELPLAAELSVLVARNPAKELVVYPPAQNWHKNGVLHTCVLPAALPSAVLQQSCQIAQAIAEDLQLVGLLAIEFFLTTNQQLLINEMAPRPHNTFHGTTMACITSQFEQLVRAVCDLPLGNPTLQTPTALINLLGDLWEPTPPQFAQALAYDSTQVHLYGKQPRPGRKMGHLLACAATPDIALQKVNQAYAQLLAPRR